MVAVNRKERFDKRRRHAADRRKRDIERMRGMCERIARRDQFDARIAREERVRSKSRSENDEEGSEEDKNRDEGPAGGGPEGASPRSPQPLPLSRQRSAL